MNPAKRLTNVLTRISAASEAEYPNAFRQRPSRIASTTCAIRLPPNSSSSFFGCLSTRSASLASVRFSRRISRNRWSFARVFGTSSAMTNAIATRAIAIRSASQLNELEELSDDPELLEERLRLTTPDRRITMIISIWIKNVLKLSSMPIEIAPAPGTPTRSQNRTSRATRAAELGTASAMNWTPYWSMSTGRTVISCRVAPIVEKACGTCANGVTINAARSQAQSACWNSLTMVSIPTSATAEMSA